MDNSELTKKQKKGRIFISNLIYDISEKLLKKLFIKYGEIIDINIPINNINNKPKGYAFIEFKNKNNGLKAIKELNNQKYKGRILKLSLAEDQRLYNKNKKSFDNENPNSENNEEDLKEEMKEEKDESKNKKEEMKEEEEDNNSLNFEEICEDENLDENENVEENKNNINKSENSNKISKENSRKNSTENLFKNEDLSNTLFVKNIQFEVTRKQFYNHFKKFGDLIYAKLCKKETLEDKFIHKGTGFVKFKNQNLIKKLIEDSKKIEENPLLASKIDPLNTFELNERRLIFKEALKKDNLINNKDLNKNNNKKRKNIKMLISEDKNNKRNLLSCLYGTISSLRPENISIKEIQIRKEYLKEKMIKMQNTNLYCSKTSVLFKNINIEFDESKLRENILKVLSKYIDEKELKNKKIIKRFRFFLKSNNKDFSGTCIVNFIQHKFAIKFLENIILKENYSLFQYKKNVPIIEFTFEDIRKINQHKQKVLKKRIKKENVNLLNKDKFKIINEQEKNRKNLAKKYLDLFIDNKKEEHKKTALEYINKLKSRGLKQRLLNKLDENLTKKIKKSTEKKDNNNKEEEVIIKKDEKEENKEKLINKKIVKKHKMNNNDLIIKESLKRRKNLKKKIFEKKAELDIFEKKHLKIK